MRPRSILFTVSLLALISGCAHFTYRDLQQQLAEPGPIAPDTQLSAAQVDADVDLALYAFDRGYGGRDFVPLPSRLEVVARLINLKGSAKTAQQVCDSLAEAFWLLPDAHLGAKLQTIPERWNKQCGTSARASRRRPAVGTNRGASVAKVRCWALQQEQLGARRLATLSITQFPDHHAPVWQGFDEAIASLLKSDAAIIDLRGNSGGDDTRGYQLADALVDASTQPQTVRTHRRQTPEALTLLLNDLDRSARNAAGELEPHLRGTYAHLEAARLAALRSESPEYQVRETAPLPSTPGPHAFGGPVAVLVDAGCASSCESTLELLRRFPRARVFGERTGGYIHFGEVGTVTLTHSGIRLDLPTKYFEYPDGVFYDKVGFAPDVPVADGSDAYEFARSWLEGELTR